MKKLLLALLSVFCIFTANAGQIANVEFIHNAINKNWGLDIEYADALKTPVAAANMKYLLTTVDVANEILNLKKTTNYGTGPYATTIAVDTAATIQAVDELIKFTADDIFIATVSATDEFTVRLSIAATGTFYIYWGHGKVQEINQTTTSKKDYSHQYKTPGTYTIRLGGVATKYNSSASVATLSFNTNKELVEVSGSLGKVFPTLSDGSQPRFYNAFAGCSNLKSVSANLFSGLSGTPTEAMFRRTFYDCTGLKDVPAGLFDSVSGQPAKNMFSETFANCTQLETIPNGLFARFYGTPIDYMFQKTFYKCTSLKQIPSNLFGNISGSAKSSMFSQTFYDCNSLTGESAKINGKYIYEIWPTASTSYIGDMYYNATGLTDYANIPSNYK